MEISRSKISVLGAIIMIVSLLFFNFITYRPNRILSGTGLNAMALFGNFPFFLLLICLVILVLSLISNKKCKMMIGILSIFIILLLVYLLGMIVEENILNAYPNGRVSIGGGFWLILLGVYMVISGTFKGYERSVLHRRVFYLLIFIIMGLFLISGHLDNLSIMKEFFNRSNTFFREITRHFSLSFFSVMVAIIMGIPTGIFIHRSKKSNSVILFLINLGQTVPTLSLLGLAMVPMAFLSERSAFLRNIGIRGVGFAPAFIILIIYSLFPIVHNTIAGLKLVDENLLEVASGLGMKMNQTFWRIQLPLSLPVVLGGIRTAMTQSIGNTILAGLIGGGGLGSIIFLGLAQAAPDLILSGIIPIVAMAFLIDSLLSFFIFFYKRKYLGLMS